MLYVIEKSGQIQHNLVNSYSLGWANADVRFGRGHATTGISEVCRYTFKGRIVYLQERSFVHARDVSRMQVFNS